MIHILNTTPINVPLLYTLYDIFSDREQELYIITNSLYTVPNWRKIVDKAIYNFSKVHLIAGLPWYLQLVDMSMFDSVSIRLAYNDDTIFENRGATSDYTLRPTVLKIPTYIIGGRKEPLFYKNMLNVTDALADYPFDIKSTLIDDDLQVYSTLDSRIGDL